MTNLDQFKVYSGQISLPNNHVQNFQVKVDGNLARQNKLSPKNIQSIVENIITEQLNSDIDLYGGPQKMDR
ncbi:hypothetical protein SCG7086_CR_00030 [Chlamydiales bacterium SCGC AG-110-P3]|nr:hypothetical protein SCG7086_CR_00030 [Chlamydiales bacterium SCGC AG-110-P3]